MEEVLYGAMDDILLHGKAKKINLQLLDISILLIPNPISTVRLQFLFVLTVLIHPQSTK